MEFAEIQFKSPMNNVKTDFLGKANWNCYNDGKCLFLSDLDGGYQCVVVNKEKREVDLALGRSRYIVENLDDRAVAHAVGFLEDIEIVQKRCAVAINVKDAAAHAAHRLRSRKVGLGKMQGDGIAAAFCHGNGIAEMSEPLRNIQLRIGRPFHGGLSRRPAATQKVLVPHPDLAEMVAINRVTRRKSDAQHLIPNTRQNLQCVYAT